MRDNPEGRGLGKGVQMLKTNQVRRIWPCLIFMALAFAWGTQGFAHPPQATASPKPAADLYVLTFIDVLPQFAAPATALARQYESASLRDAGLVRFEVLAQQNGRENHITLLVVWRTQKAFEAHEAMAHTKEFREKLLPMLGSPFDERLNEIVPPA
jgi:quinol monooxygenase YgiN